MGTFADHGAEVEILSSVDILAQRCLDVFVADARKAIDSSGVFHIAISGGYTPKHFFELLAESPAAATVPWDKIHLFWVDERYVPVDSQWSNYKLAYDTFISRVAIPQENIHRIPTEPADFMLASRSYEDKIREVFNLAEGQFPEFDLIILGMGAEGHTGSLFPNSYASFDTADLACVVFVMDEKLNRITLTYPVLCAAKHIVVLVSGEEKAEILRTVLTSEPDEVQYPIHLLWPVLDKVTWLIDSDAAKLLED